MEIGVRMQTAMVLDELPPDVLAKIESNQENLEEIKFALENERVSLSGYFDKISDPEKQVEFTANCIYNYLAVRRERKTR